MERGMMGNKLAVTQLQILLMASLLCSLCKLICHFVHYVNKVTTTSNDICACICMCVQVCYLKACMTQ